VSSAAIINIETIYARSKKALTEANNTGYS